MIGVIADVLRAAWGWATGTHVVIVVEEVRVSEYADGTLLVHPADRVSAGAPPGVTLQ